jgi:hypothetical protein
MCLLPLPECLPNDASVIFANFVYSTVLVDHSLIPCKWEEACRAPSPHDNITSNSKPGSSDHRVSPLSNQGILCPYIEILHGQGMVCTSAKQENYDHVLIDGVSVDHGCKKCRARLFEYDFVRRMPSQWEKARYLARIRIPNPSVQTTVESTVKSSRRSSRLTESSAVCLGRRHKRQRDESPEVNEEVIRQARMKRFLQAELEPRNPLPSASVVPTASSTLPSPPLDIFSDCVRESSSLALPRSTPSSTMRANESPTPLSSLSIHPLSVPSRKPPTSSSASLLFAPRPSQRQAASSPSPQLSDGEVIPDAPWTINKRKSETYQVAEAKSLLKNWNSSTDTSFLGHFGHLSQESTDLNTVNPLVLPRVERAQGFTTAATTTGPTIDDVMPRPVEIREEVEEDSDDEADSDEAGEDEDNEESDEDDLWATNQHLTKENARLQADNDRLRRQVRLLNNVREMLQRQSPASAHNTPTTHRARSPSGG